MSRKRHTALVDPRGQPGAAVTSLVYDYAASQAVPPHVHDEHQLVYASDGVMRVQAASAVWTIPPQQAVWIPARVEHSLKMLGRVRMATLYFARGFPVARETRAVNVTPLLREVVLHSCELGTLDRRKPRERRLLGVLVDQIEACLHAGIQLALPRDPRALRVAQTLLGSEETERPSLGSACASAGGSRRTIERAFRAETGMALGEWHRRATLSRAIGLLSRGLSVSAVALEMGYATPSAFVVMFRRALGTTPRRYLARATDGARGAGD